MFLFRRHPTRWIIELTSAYWSYHDSKKIEVIPYYPGKDQLYTETETTNWFYLLRDCTGTINELSFGEAVGGGDLQSSGLLDQEDTPMSELLHSSLDLETNLDKTEGSNNTNKFTEENKNSGF